MFIINILQRSLGQRTAGDARRSLLQVYDSTGVDDANPVLKVSQRELEEKVQSLVLMASRDLGTVSGLLDHLSKSPFLRRWIVGHLDPNAPSKPFLSAMISL